MHLILVPILKEKLFRVFFGATEREKEIKIKKNYKYQKDLNVFFSFSNFENSRI